jgi:hypothetical protein
MTYKKYLSLCWFCKHFDHVHWSEKLGYFRCHAFPERIPSGIINIEVDHREPHPDDNGIQFDKVGLFSDYMQRRPFDNFSLLEEVDEAFAATINWLELIKQDQQEVGMDAPE